MHCLSCNSAAIIYDESRGEKICTRCGLVIVERRPDLRPEWHMEPGENSGRTDVTSGLDVTHHDMGLGGDLGSSYDLSPSWRSKLRRLRKWHRRSRASNYQEKSLRQALVNIDKLCENLDLPKSMRAEMSVLYRKARDKNLISGRNTWEVLGALSFILCRIRGISRTEREVVHALKNLTSIDETRACRALRRIRKIMAEELGLQVPRSKAEEYIDRFTTSLDLPRKIAAAAHRICTSLPDSFKRRKAAFLLAASSIYVAAKDFEVDIKIMDLSKTLGVGVSSVSKTGKKIKESLRIPQE